MGWNRDDRPSPDMTARRQPGSVTASTRLDPWTQGDAAMPMPDEESVTRLLGDAGSGKPDAWNRIYALLYRDLHQIARAQIRQQRRSHVRSPTSLISETWLKLASADFSVENRAHLVALVARAMRFVLLDEVRRALAEKRGEGMDLLPLDETTEPVQTSRLEQLLILDQALTDLGKLDARLAQVVEMRYFGGLSELEIADVLKVTERTVRRDWRKARAFLFSHLGEGELPEQW
ncbi:RNA polymerase subunit sigma-70 [Pseudoxanthomonas mexicana]|nr:RNA polymerase subunit sigma-70 [Pseudoxanthomonas mexicana]